MCFFVVSESQTGSTSSMSEEVLSKFLVDETAALRSDSELICLRRALEALSVWQRLSVYLIVWSQGAPETDQAGTAIQKPHALSEP